MALSSLPLPNGAPARRSAAMLSELEQRDLVAQVSAPEALAAHLAGGSRVLYAGFDPTAPSLQVGNLVTLLMLRRFQLAGHRPILLLGGATGLIGDPSGRAEERTLHDEETVRGYVAALAAQAARFIDLDDGSGGRVVNNLDWTDGLGVIPFLRDVGKHFAVNAMMQRDSVRERLAREGGGISYTEFSYMLLQAYDYLQLARRYDCTLQLGGSDQWGNIVSGIDLVRRTLQRPAYALTHPLVTHQDGTKFGKSAAGAVWLDAEHTSPYAFHQFWLNSADADVMQLLRRFTLLEQDALADAEREVKTHPERRAGQRLLAAEVTRLVHGEAALAAAERIAAALFAGEARSLSASDFAQLQRDGMACTALPPGSGLLEALASAGLAASNGAARQLVQAGGIQVNGEVATDATQRLLPEDALHGRYFAVRRGKKHWRLLVLKG